MKPTLARELTKLASNIVSAETTLSQYFTIGCIKVRFSDHESGNSDCDLAIYETGPGYTAVPHIGMFKKVEYFSNIPSLIDYIKNFEHFAMIFVKTVLQNPVHVEHQKAVKAKKKEKKAKKTGAVVATIVKNAIDVAEWVGPLQVFTTQKSPVLLPLLEEIFQIIPKEQVEGTIKDLKLFGGLEAQQRYTAIQKYLEKVKETYETQSNC